MKVAASPRIYMGVMPESSISVTSHRSLGAPNPQSLIPSHSSLLSNLDRGTGRPLIMNESSTRQLEVRSVGAAHKNQKRRGGLKLAIFSYRKPNP